MSRWVGMVAPVCLGWHVDDVCSTKRFPDIRRCTGRHGASSRPAAANTIGSV